MSKIERIVITNKTYHSYEEFRKTDSITKIPNNFIGCVEIATTDLKPIIFYLKNKKFHNENGPAYIEYDYLNYFLNGKLHRLDGPAVISKYTEAYWINGKRHRLDGPARIWKNHDYKEYYINDEFIPEKQFNLLSNLYKIKGNKT